MVQSKAETVDTYLEELPPERREAVEAVREVILDNLPEGFEEGIQFGMISYHVPLERYPDTYNGKPLGYVHLANQKNYVSVYLHGIYASEAEREWFEEAYRTSGKRLDMGKSCVRFRDLEDLPLDLIGKAVARMELGAFIQLYEQASSR